MTYMTYIHIYIYHVLTTNGRTIKFAELVWGQGHGYEYRSPRLASLGCTGMVGSAAHPREAQPHVECALPVALNKENAQDTYTQPT